MWSKYPNSICEKNQTPWTIRYFGDLAKFSRILHENKILSEHSHFILHLAMISLLHWLEHRVKRCQIFRKKNSEKKNCIFWSIREILAKSPKYRIVQGVCFFPRIVQVFFCFFSKISWIVQGLCIFSRILFGYYLGT